MASILGVQHFYLKKTKTAYCSIKLRHNQNISRREAKKKRIRPFTIKHKVLSTQDIIR